jgi:aldehyde:ferredoxin oxidoreductase
MGKILRIDLSTSSVKVDELEEKTARKYLGGCGLGSKILSDETGPETNPLGAENVMVFASGPLNGSGLFNSNRFDVVSKSPLTGIFAESSAGGYWGGKFKACGYDALVIKGVSEKPVYISITETSVEIKDAAFIWGKDTFDSTDILKEAEGKNAKAAVIGEAGEKQVLISCIITDGIHGRALGRCGLGAVMGSKNLKAVVVNGNLKPKLADSTVIKNISKSMSVLIKQNMKAMEEAGTANGLQASEELGNLPVKNWYQGSWAEGAKKTTGFTLTKTLLTGNYNCGSCMIKCGRIVKVEGGPHHGKMTAGPEYETMGLMGTNLLNDNISAILKANELCNRYGLDTISAGGVLGFAMEAWEHGLITAKDTDGIQMEWGRTDAIEKMLEQIGEKRSFGAVLGGGVKRASLEIGGISGEFAAEVKGLEPPAHDGRAKFTAAIGMATSARGACHLSGFSHDFEEGAVLEDLGLPALSDRFISEGKAENVARMQNLMGMLDSAVACKFALFGGLTINPLIDAINAATGWNMDREEFFRTGERIFNIKRLYNAKLGLSRKDDTLPIRMLRHIRGGGTNHLPPLNIMLNEYYRIRGWNEFGLPTDKKTAELELEEYAAP